MTPEEQRIELAKLDGWKTPDDPEVMKLKVGWVMPEKWWMDPKGVLQFQHSMPDYLNDLNAVHELEKKLFDNASMDERSLWLDTLAVCCNWPDTKNAADLKFEVQYRCARATATQHCEAILKVKGLWR